MFDSVVAELFVLRRLFYEIVEALLKFIRPLFGDFSSEKIAAPVGLLKKAKDKRVNRE